MQSPEGLDLHSRCVQSSCQACFFLSYLVGSFTYINRSKCCSEVLARDFLYASLVIVKLIFSSWTDFSNCNWDSDGVLEFGLVVFLMGKVLTNFQLEHAVSNQCAWSSCFHLPCCSLSISLSGKRVYVAIRISLAFHVTASCKLWHFYLHCPMEQSIIVWSHLQLHSFQIIFEYGDKETSGGARRQGLCIYFSVFPDNEVYV